MYSFSTPHAITKNEIPKFLKQITKLQIVEMSMEDHDCHSSPHDGCKACQEIEDLKDFINSPSI